MGVFIVIRKMRLRFSSSILCIDRDVRREGENDKHLSFFVFNIEKL